MEQLKTINNLNEVKELIFETLYQVEGFDGIKDFVLFAITDSKKTKENNILKSMIAIFESQKIRNILKEEDKPNFNALLKIWLNEMENILRLE